MNENFQNFLVTVARESNISIIRKMTKEEVLNLIYIWVDNEKCLAAACDVDLDKYKKACENKKDIEETFRLIRSLK